MPPGPSIPEVDSMLNISLTVDLFDHPQRAAYREQIMLLRAEGMAERKIAQELGLTITATQNAAALDRIMKTQELTDPYVEVTVPPPDCTRLRRHRHKRYRFEPLGDSCVNIS
jgi:isopentenyldiphosphate isomerase